jgi:hypothetical protein
MIAFLTIYDCPLFLARETFFQRRADNMAALDQRRRTVAIAAPIFNQRLLSIDKPEGARIPTRNRRRPQQESETWDT